MLLTESWIMEGKEEADLEQQQVNEMASQWWKDPDCIRRSMSGWYSLWGNVGEWGLTAVESSEMVSSRPASTKDHTVVAVETDPSSLEEAGRG
jgi:hypothetical protein